MNNKKTEMPRDNWTLESFGGTGGFVTGSCHRVVAKDSVFLVDCGIYQGKFEERSARGERRNFEPTIDYANKVSHILVGHAHADHIARIPMIYKSFSPKTLATEATAAFMEPMLQNSAEIQLQEHPSNRLYESWDVDRALRSIKVVKPFEKVPIGQEHSDISAEFVLNGHVPGASSIIARGKEKTVLFTSDMGKPEQTLCGGYKDYVKHYPKDPIDVLVVESTSFEREPVSIEEARTQLKESIKESWERGGNPILPALSFHRAQTLMEDLHYMQKTGEIPKDCYIFIDAPLAMKVTETFKKLGPEHLTKNYGDEENYYNEESSMARFDIEGVSIIDSHKDSQYNDRLIAKYPGKTIGIVSGGMGDKGRFINYKTGEFCRNEKNTVILTCFQVPGTAGSYLVKDRNVMYGKKVGAKVIQIQGFTSHISGPEQTFELLESYDIKTRLSKVIITHGKDSARHAMATEFKRRGYSAEIVLSKVRQVIEI